MEENEHHPWCNYFMRPRKGCGMCYGLYKQYPTTGKLGEELRGEDLLATYFPDVVTRI